MKQQSSSSARLGGRGTQPKLATAVVDLKAQTDPTPRCLLSGFESQTHEMECDASTLRTHLELKCLLFGAATGMCCHNLYGVWEFVR